jgi:hypothetical protein
MNILDTMFSDLRTVISGIVIKFEKYAKQYETLDTIRESDRYIAAMNKEDTFHTYQTFALEAVLRAGVNDPTLAEKYATDKTLIPNNKQDDILLQQRRYVIESYVEENNYYRMLTGLPDLDDKNYFYIDEAIGIELEIDHTLPLHEISTDDILKLDKKGVIGQLIADNPDKMYLKYLGENKIDLVRARTSKNFAILDLPRDISESFYDDFNNTYEQCREYFMTVIHLKDFAGRYDLYDNFIGLMIMIMTVQRVFANTFKAGIERDFYDLGSIQMLFQAYNVPFIEDLPLDYQRMLVRNLNNLLYYKSTDRVLYDICSILGFERIQIFKYFLIKEHKLDADENPIFLYKEVEDADGNKHVVEDVEKMYDLYFRTVELRDRNMALSLSNNTNRMEYDQVIIDDPYWWDDDTELRDTLYNAEYNYVETKYLNMNIMYKLTEMLFEVIYVFRMLIDKKDQIGEITIELPKLFEKREIPLFSVVVFLCALISRKNGMAGNIISTPSKSLSVMGFNFQADFAKIREDILKDPKLDDRMASWVANLFISDAEDVNRLFTNVRNLNDFIVEQLGKTQDIEAYRAYKKLYDALMVTQHTEAVFKLKDGGVAETFLEYLDDTDNVLADFVRTAEEGRLTEYIEHILFRINGAIPELQYLYILNDSNNVLLNAAIKLIRFFKSYTTDLASFNILYLMNSRYHNMIKLIHDVENLEKTLGVNEDTLNFLYRTNARYGASITKKERINLAKKEIEQYTKTLVHKDRKPKLRDTIKVIREV